ncbi:MAG: hypothetical protein ACPG4T_20845, partial [Nannocystaceae bacterium]
MAPRPIGTRAMTPAERARRYRQRIKADPTLYAEWRMRERERDRQYRRTNHHRRTDPGFDSPEMREHLRKKGEALQRYFSHLRSPRWAELRRRAIEAAGGRCTLCNSPDDLQAHHRTYERFGG